VTPVSGHHYIRYNGGDSSLSLRIPQAGWRSGRALFRRGKTGPERIASRAIIETESPKVQKVFGSTRWKIMDTGGGLRRWQMDCYYGEDEPLGPGKFMGRRVQPPLSTLTRMRES